MNAPKEIKRLDTVVINRIAAGEVIQRPANALKEMIENSIDAKATNIFVTVNMGGLKFLQVQDNGTGIRREDLEIVCERFTTSKLQTFNDLSNISTYGFRGEALASISHVAHLTIQTKTANEKCAYKALYVDGKLKEKPRSCAGQQGTQITVEDLFYNIATRKAALKNHNEEFQKIYDVVSKYAIHNATIGFCLKKLGEKNYLRTPFNGTSLDNIRIVYGNTTSKELIEINYVNTELKFTLTGLVSNLNYSKKKLIFLLFINNRLVESTNLRKAIDSIYAAHLPKHSYPYLYLALGIDANNCDVNVHPTKHEVHFLYEDAIIAAIQTEIESKLMNSKISRVFYTQSLLPGGSKSNVDEVKELTANKSLVADKVLVRTDSKEQKLERFYSPVVKANEISQSCPNDQIITLSQLPEKKNLVEVKLRSVFQLRKLIEKDCDGKLRDLFVNHKFVGIIDSEQSLIQYDVKLYLCNTIKLSEELFYQILISDFQNFIQIRLENPLCIYDLIVMALELSILDYDPETDGCKEEIAKAVKNILIQKRDMLNVYFALEINDDGFLLAVPMLLDDLVPDFSNLPLYLLKLATEVNWEIEQACFDTFSRETAIFYSATFTSQNVEKNKNWSVEHVLFPALKKYFLPPKAFGLNGYLLQLAHLPDLYRVFERC